MKKVILVDGNNLLFRSYYATAYNGNLMKNSSGFPTNAVYGLVNMINKIISEEKPEYIAVAFDIGKTFRHEKYEDYKKGRSETPDELKMQFPVAKKILTAMGIKYLECEGYEADDIIGTLAKKAYIDKDFKAVIISSDKDLLQLINEETEVKLLKTKDHIRMTKEEFIKTYGIEPIKMIDLKALMGDPSDNIKGVKGIGEKTALKLLQQYNSLEGIYDNIDKLSPSIKTKLTEDKPSAFESKELATIYLDVPLNIEFEDIKYQKENTNELIEIYNDLEFYSFLRKVKQEPLEEEKLEFKVITNIEEIKIDEPVAIYLELDNNNYHKANIKAMGVYNNKIAYYIPDYILKQNPSFLTTNELYTYDYKKIYVKFLYDNIKIDNIVFDTMLASYLVNYNVKEDIESLAIQFGYNFSNTDDNLEQINCIKKAKFIFETKEILEKELKEAEVYDFYNQIELPLSKVLGNMEYEGIRVNPQVLIDMKKDIQVNIDKISKEIYNLAGEEFNISSPKQLGEILFEKLKLPFGKKNKNGAYTTDVNVLNKLKYDYPIAALTLEYRSLIKLRGTYIDGILDSICDDGKIHTIYTQAITRTGRLSSTEPNLQNIPARNEYGRLIRKAFIAEENSLIMSSDYSQIELRIFAHLSQAQELIEAFNSNMDIHTKTAMDIFNVSENEVTKDMRRHAKAVNFGILYGISSFGLSEELEINPKDAKTFIEKYFLTYPSIKEYMLNVIENAHKDGYVKTIMNRKRIIDEINNKNQIIKKMGERMALNTPIQGSSADILKKAMVEIDTEFQKLNLKSKMLLQVHDELIFNCVLEEKEIVTKIVTEIMENTYKISVPLQVDVEFGSNWYEAK